MKSYKTIINEMKDIRELRSVIEVYEEVAATKMQKIRSDTLVSRDFFDGLMKVSEDVGVDLENLKMEKPSKEAAVFVSANSGLYGDIITKTFGLFASYIRDKAVDVYVVGRVGEEMMKRALPNVPCKLIEMSDEEIEADKFARFSESLVNYGKITVVYGRFGNIINQYSHASTVSGETIREPRGKKMKKEELLAKRLRYFYEPSISSISEFFGNEVLKATFEAMLRESQLAKFGSRLMHLDAAINKIDDKLVVQGMERRKIAKRVQEKKQRQVLAGVLFR